MNYCTRCASHYIRPGTCNCFAGAGLSPWWPPVYPTHPAYPPTIEPVWPTWPGWQGGTWIGGTTTYVPRVECENGSISVGWTTENGGGSTTWTEVAGLDPATPTTTGYHDTAPG